MNRTAQIALVGVFAAAVVALAIGSIKGETLDRSTYTDPNSVEKTEVVISESVGSHENYKETFSRKLVVAFNKDAPVLEAVCISLNYKAEGKFVFDPQSTQTQEYLNAVAPELREVVTNQFDRAKSSGISSNIAFQTTKECGPQIAALYPDKLDKAVRTHQAIHKP